MNDKILTTKLFVPVKRRKIVALDRLTAKLDSGVKQYGKLALVTAPAGFGKTTFVAGWVKNSGKKYAWLSLDEGDNDTSAFFRYLLAALRGIDGNIGADAQAMLDASNPVTPQSVITSLINDISALALPCILVLDDYHVIANAVIHGAVEFLINNSPPNFFTTIVSRQNPPFSFGKMRAKNRIVEIGADELRFTDKETRQFLTGTMELRLSNEQSDSLKKKTEGWAAGLQLAALSIKGKDETRIDEYIDAFGGTQNYVVDYFFEEILRTQSDEIKNFLYKTSLLSRLCAPLCDELVSSGDSQRILCALEELNLFIAPLDNERRWYRYHPLFSEYLSAQLESREKTQLHRAAARWLAGNGFLDEAIDHALSGDDTENAVKLISEQLKISLANYDLSSVISLLDRLPDDSVYSDGMFCSYKALAHFLSSETEKAEYYTSAYKPSSEADALNSGRMNGVKAMMNDCSADTIPLASEALRLIGEKDPFARMVALISLAHAQRNFGELQKSNESFGEALELCIEYGYTMPLYSVYMDLAYNYNIQGNLKKAINLCTGILSDGETTDQQSLAARNILNIPLSTFYLESNELALAQRCAEKGLEVAKSMRIHKVLGRDAEMVIAKVKFIQGRCDAATTLLRQCIAESEAAGLPIAVLRLGATLADIQIKLGNTAWAESWIEENQNLLDGDISSSNEMLYFVYARLLLIKEQWQDAGALLDEMELFSRRCHRNGRLVSILALKALLFDALGESDSVKAALREAVHIAAYQNYRRSLLNEGGRLIELLAQVRDEAADFIRRVEGDYRAEAKRKNPSEKIESSSENVLPVFEQLSERELDIVRLIAEGLSNEQISERLYISLGTVKWHVYNIFSKLGVKNRMQAINKVKELDIL